MHRILIFLGFVITTFSNAIAQHKTEKEAIPSFFEQIFDEGSSFKRPGLEFKFDIVNLGRLCIPSGELAMGDLSKSQFISLKEHFPKGSFPMELAITKEQDSLGWEFPVFVRLTFSNAKVANWRFAKFQNQKVLKIGDSTKFSCSGQNFNLFGCIGDARTLKKKRMENQNFKLKQANLKRQGKKWFFASDGTFALVYGDFTPCYNVYIGTDLSGQIVRVLINTDILQFAPQFYRE